MVRFACLLYLSLLLVAALIYDTLFWLSREWCCG